MKRPALVVWALAKVVIVGLAVGWCALRLLRLDPWLGLSLPSWSRTPGLVLLVLGSALVLACGRILGTQGILETPGDRFFPKAFVVRGPFRYLRNPMSLGAIILLLGLGLFESSATILLLALALFLCLHLLIVYVEEPGLDKRFGESYQKYRGSVNRWFPRFPVR